ncbi:MAG TPA: ATP-binding protein, partial [Candidatus Angelobacter sp.]|nr:ATP-binding protein [Candidatus Angelobacter sp.]
LNVAVTAALETVRASAATRNIHLAVSLSPISLIVMGEPVRLQQISWNLLSNAIKFTEPGGKVSIATQREGSDALLIVEDTGIGIDPAFLPHVFDRFRQADGSTSRLHGGLGLGLAIAHALAKMHGGTMEAASGGVGHGARFTLRLGLSRDANLSPETTAEKAYSLDGLDVLLVEDSSDTLNLLSAMFRQEGARVLSALSATEALQLLVTKKPSLIISDIGMPGVDGYTFLKKVRELPCMGDVPAIAISGYASAEDRERAQASGYIALIAKPINIDNLFSFINELKLPALSRSSN